MEKMARKDAVKLLVTRFDETVDAYQGGHPHQLKNPNWPMPVRFSMSEWHAIIDALRPMAED